MHRMNRVVLVLLLVFLPFLAWADGRGDMESRLSELEKQQAEIYHTLAEKKDAGLGSAIAERISLSGLIEVEAAAESIDFADGSSEAQSDLVLATAQLGLGVEVGEKMTADLILLFEEGEDFTVDEALFRLENRYWFGQFGLQYLPFGLYNSHFISDPMTLELGETQETALLAGFEQNHLSLSYSFFLFNGEAEETGQEDHIRDWGASLSLAPVDGVELGGSYLSDLADTGAELAFDEVADTNEYGQRVAGWSAYAILALGDFELSGEILAAAKAFDSADLDGDLDGQGDEPMAWNAELAWVVSDSLELAGRYEGSDEFVDQPEEQYGVCVSWSPRTHVSLSLEYLHADFDPAFVGGGEEERDMGAAQLAFEF